MAQKSNTDIKRTLPIARGAGNAWALERSFPLRQRLEELASAAPLSRREAKASHSTPSFRNLDGTEVSSMDSGAADMIRECAVAIIPIKGLMAREARSYEVYFGVCSTERVTKAIEAATMDPRITGIVITAYSPGGQVAGCERLAAAVAAAKATKKVIAHVERACSGAMWGIVNAEEIYLDGQTASTGSIGVMMELEADNEKWFDAIGVDHVEVKADGSEEKNAAYDEALKGKPEALKSEELNPLREAFVATVQTGRGTRLKVTKGNDPLKGRMYTGQDAIDAGLADGFATLEECIAKARGTATQENPETPNAMAKNWKDAWAIAKEVLGFKQAATEPNAEQLAEANAALKENGMEGMVMVSASQAKDLGAVATLRTELEAARKEKTDADTAKAEAEKNLTALQAKVNAAVLAAKLPVKEGETPVDALLTAKAEDDKAIAASIEANKIEVEVGKTPAQALAAAADKWGGEGASAHAGRQRKEDKKNDGSDDYPSLKAAEKDGISMGAK